MSWLILLAAKSLVIAGGALLLLKLMQKRSPADRSWIAHLALAALLILPFASFAAPTLDVVGPELLVGRAQIHPAATAVAPLGDDPSQLSPADKPVGEAVVSQPAGSAAQPDVGGKPIDWPLWAYGAPAALLLLLTAIALARLVILKARATVLVDAPWLTALARAQRRMGFKHGTALLTSNELPSPISWGILRPVILLNSDAAESHEQAEAIITHELAHVARLDWAKLLLSRIAVAVFWFNPFVWLLAREAHQLREEAADDAVLATNIDGAEYASLLIGVARHECRGLLIGAHGVAPGRNSLTRRVKRVLDGAVKRAPGGWRWGSAAAFFAAGMAVPVAALNLVQAPAAAATEAANGGASLHSNAPQAAAPVAAQAAAVAAAAGASIADVSQIVGPSGEDTMAMNSSGASVVTRNGQTILRSADGRTVAVSAPDSSGRRRVVLDGPQGHLVSYMDEDEYRAAFGAHRRQPRDAINDAIEMKAVGATPEYVASIRAAAPQLRDTPQSEITEMRAVGVTPDYIRALVAAGYSNLTPHQIVNAYASGLSPQYIRDIAAAGYPGISFHDLTALQAMGVTPADLERFRRAGLHPTAAQMVQIKALGLTPEEVRGAANSP